MRAESILTVRNLTITGPAGQEIVHGISFEVGRGELLGIVGSSGGGKTSTALAMMGYSRRGLRISGGEIMAAGRDLVSAPDREIRRIRGQVIAYVPQDPRSALTPHRRLGALLDEAMRHLPRGERDDRRRALLREVELPAPDALLDRFPHELSGGQLQRFALALALAGGPEVIILDEPTSALDRTTRDALLDQICRIRERLGVAFVVVTHDLAGVASRLDRVLLLEAGRMMPLGEPGRQPTAFVPDPRPEPGMAAVPLLRIDHLSAWYDPSKDESVLRDVSFDLETGSCIALVGRSGCGKSTLARCVAGLHDRWQGRIELSGQSMAQAIRNRALADRRRIQIVFQNPYSSLNPRQSVADLIGRPIVLRGDGRNVDAEVRRLLEEMRLPDRFASRYPRELSGGERQRVAIARALAAQPEILICDEITSALDSATQDSILEVLERIRRERDLALLVITHDEHVASTLADRTLRIENGTIAKPEPVTVNAHAREIPADAGSVAPT